jgi:uncharacterized protein
LHDKWAALVSILEQEESVLVAFSGGCDSAFLAAAARQVLGKPAVLAVTAVSASLPTQEKQAVQNFVTAFDIEHVFITTDELQNPKYTANPSNRCFFCKTELFEKLTPLAKNRNMRLVDGFNLSDRFDYRPGFQAAQEWNVEHPLDEANLDKHAIRTLSRWMHLPTWNKPASPCLSSRIPYGAPVTSMTLMQIDRAENVLRSDGFPVVRVRHFGDTAKIEVPLSDIPRLKMIERWSRVVNALKKIGYTYVSLDPRGFKSGRLNEILGQESKIGNETRAH